jgi:hypothetical protein
LPSADAQFCQVALRANNREVTGNNITKFELVVVKRFNLRPINDAKVKITNPVIIIIKMVRTPIFLGSPSFSIAKANSNLPVITIEPIITIPNHTENIPKEAGVNILAITMVPIMGMI